MKNNWIEISVAGGLVVLALLVLNPFSFWMPDMMMIAILALALALFGFFASFVLRERAYDERDEVHQSLAGRNAFLAGSGVLVVGIGVQGYLDTVDPWLVTAFVVMVVVKLASRLWSDRNL